MIDSFQIGTFDRTDILSYLTERKHENSAFTIIDVGASMNAWSRDVVDAIVDIHEPDEADLNSKIRVFRAYLNNPADWLPIERYVEENGKFDFSICSHTLEDISNPKYVCEKLALISKGGYVAVPSKYRELARFEFKLQGNHNYYRGYIHHRWIFSIRDKQFIAFPKINYLDMDPWFDAIADLRQEVADLSFLWRDEIPFKIVNDDYLGPNVLAVIRYYKELLINDDVDRLKKSGSSDTW